jgi:hypothetical protein
MGKNLHPVNILYYLCKTNQGKPTKPTAMKTKFYATSKNSVSARETMTVYVTDSENVKREYGISALDVCDADFVNQQIKEHADVYETEITKIEVFTWEGKKFKTINLRLNMMAATFLQKK